MTDAAGIEPSARLERRIPAGSHRGELHVRPRAGVDAGALGTWWARNRAHLEPTQPVRDEAFWSVDGQRARIAADAEDVAAGRLLPLLVAEDGELVAEVSLSGIARGPFCSAHLGYNVDVLRLRRGIATAAVSAACDIAGADLDLHRLEAATLVENIASQGVLLACGFERIGLARRYLAIAGDWRDHVLWQRVFDERASGDVRR